MGNSDPLMTLAVLRVTLLAMIIALGVASVAAALEGSGQPLPRFVSLRAGEVNMRLGPGEQYPIEWVYQRAGMPMEVVAEYYTWRRVRDWRGTEGWIHTSMLSSRRAMVVSGDIRSLRAEPGPNARYVANIEPGVIGRLMECPQGSTWCRVEIEGFRGWLRRNEFWGVYDQESVD